MAIYDYQCDACEQKFEITHSMKDAPRTKCPGCGKNTLKRLISTGIGLVFRGTGFWSTDYKNKK
jgi:putative FmdB family regulatory protein